MDKQLPENNKKPMASQGSITSAEQQRDELVLRFIRQAKMLQATIKTFKDCCLNEVDIFIDSTIDYQNKTTNEAMDDVQLLSFDGKYKIRCTFSKSINLDKHLQIAKKLIDICVNRWGKGTYSDAEILIKDAFKVDSTGQINIRRILNLKRLDIKDDEWQTAMQFISQSGQVINNKNYIHLYERVENNGKWKPILLDIAFL